MNHNPEECPVCMSVFDDTVQRPHTLPCGHTVCTLCINKLKLQDYVTCPECRISHTVPDGGQFPVCYTVEALIRRMRDVEAAAAASPPPSAGTERGVAAAAGQKEAAGLSRKMRSFLQEQEASALAAITACQKVQAQLDLYQKTLRSWGEQQQQLEDRLQGLLDQSRSVRELVQQEESLAATKKEEARDGELQLHAALEALRSPSAEQEARVAVAEMFRCTFEAKEVFEECQRSFPNANTATTVRKMREASHAALEAFQAAQVALKAYPFVTKGKPRPQSEGECTIEDRLQAILTPSLKQVEFTVDRSKTGNQSGWNPQKVEAEFLKLFKRASNDEIFGWIDANYGNYAKSSKFIRAFVTALVESQATTSNDGSTIRAGKDFEENMKKRLAVLLKYVDGNENLEMQCLYALQALCVKHRFPKGLLEKCFNVFYDSEVVSEEAFEEWARSKDPEEREGKGVCITSVQNFLRWLKEADEEG